MRKLLTTQSGFTLVEILVSVGIMVALLPVLGSVLINSQLLASTSKHKIQAAYAAQQLIEAQRQSAFVLNQTIPAAGSNAVVLDTKGNYTSFNCNNSKTGDFCGTAVMKITPAVYTNSAGQQTTSATVAHCVVTIQWNEQILNSKKTMTAIFAEDIANDTMLN